jgi:CRISPR-associated protein Cas2
MRHLVVSYDIVDDARRARVAKFLRGYLIRVQKSVFEGEIEDNRYEPLKEGVEKRVDLAEDTVRFYTLCARCHPLTEIQGTGVFIERDDDDLLF